MKFIPVRHQTLYNLVYTVQILFRHLKLEKQLRIACHLIYVSTKSVDHQEKSLKASCLRDANPNILAYSSRPTTKHMRVHAAGFYSTNIFVFNECNL